MFGVNTKHAFSCKSFRISVIAVETFPNSPDSSGMAIFRFCGLNRFCGLSGCFTLTNRLLSLP